MQITVIFLFSIGDWYNEHKQKIRFWLGRIYIENQSDLFWFLFFSWAESYDFSHRQSKLQITFSAVINIFFLTSFISFLNISQKPSQLTVYLDIILFWKVIIFYGNDASTATVSLSDIITLDLVENRELRCL